MTQSDQTREAPSDTERERELVAKARKQAESPSQIGDATKTGLPQAGRRSASQAEETQPSISGYRIERKVQAGGQGVVYQAIQESTGKKVAIKVIRHGPLADPRHRARLERGIHILGQLDHPGIVRIIDSGSEDGALYYVMDYITGHSLDEWLSLARRSSLEGARSGSSRRFWSSRRRAVESSRHQRASVQELLRLFIKICDAVAAAHVRGVIHRDLKPGNILIDERGQPHILDFDLAKILPGDLDSEGRWIDMTQTGEFLGSLRWASPEQVERIPAKIDLRTDVYSLGVILYEVLTGQSPYPTYGTHRDLEAHILGTEPARPSTLRRRLDDDVDTIILKCLAKEPPRRYTSAAAVADDLRDFLAGAPISARRDSSWYVLRKLACRHAAATVALISVFVILASATAVSIHFYRREQQSSEERRVLAENAIQQAGQSEQQALMAQAQVHRMALGWFLLAWHADQLQRAKTIRDATPAGTPERLAMQFLLDPTYPGERFQAELSASYSSMGYFITGERWLKSGDTVHARQAYETGLSLSGSRWYKDVARARLQQIIRRSSSGEQEADPNNSGVRQ